MQLIVFKMNLQIILVLFYFILFYLTKPKRINRFKDKFKIILKSNIGRVYFTKLDHICSLKKCFCQIIFIKHSWKVFFFPFDFFFFFFLFFLFFFSDHNQTTIKWYTIKINIILYSYPLMVNSLFNNSQIWIL